MSILDIASRTIRALLHRTSSYFHGLSILTRSVKRVLSRVGSLRIVDKPLDYVSDGALRQTAGITLLIWMVVATDAFGKHLDRWEPPLMLALVVAVILVTQSLRLKQYEIKATVFLLSQLVLISLLVHTHGDLSLGHLFVLAITMAGAFLGPMGVLLETFLAVLCQCLVYWALRDDLPGVMPLAATLITTLLAALVHWSSSLALLSAFKVVERMSKESRGHILELRARQGELNRTIKALTETEERLARANIELIRAKDIAEEAQRFKTQLASRVSHELRTPLNLIIGFSETMVFSPQSYGEALPIPYRRDVAEVHRASRHLMGLVTDILDLAKLQSGQLALTTEPVSVADIVLDAERMLKNLTDRKGLWLRHEFVEDIPLVMVDKTRIRQVLLNLLSNAARLTSKGGITVRAFREKDHVHVEVTDTGPGIPQDQLGRVFEEFRPIQDPRVRHQQGIGLGLSISKEIINLHGGRIWGQSCVGEGTMFGFSLPCMGASHYSQLITLEHTRAKPSELPAVIIVGQQGRAPSSFLRRHLEDFAVVEASGWAQLTETVHHEGARAIIASTETMPEQIPKEIKVPVIACPLDSMSAAAQLGEINAFLEKPVTIGMIRACLAQYACESMRILLIAQNPFSARMLMRMIAAYDTTYAVLRAFDQEQLVEHLESGHPTLVVLDRDTSIGEQASEIVLLIRSRYSKTELPIVVLAWDDADHRTGMCEVKLIQPSGLTVTESLHYAKALLDAVSDVGTVHLDSRESRAS